ncbi:MAG: sigma-54 dependent transcriptional regulator [Thermodesulfovibrionales bacterium]|nr:sigma-54 dependent transcriptional regulator [Thermodesulfovibrionales bacterium]
MQGKILLVEYEEETSDLLKKVIRNEGHSVDCVRSAEEALRLLGNSPYDLVITDIALPGIDGIELLNRVKEISKKTIVIVMTSYPSLETSVEALRAGAFDYITKPILYEELIKIIKKAFDTCYLNRISSFYSDEFSDRYDFSNIVGNSNEIKRIISQVQKIANARSNILVVGETGTGKELIARAIHYNSVRADMPFIPINCSAIPENLLESELFGYVKGAFTGAVISKKGLLEEAHGGTVFLDEIADLSLRLQAKILRVLEDHEIRPVGGNQSQKINLRFVCATNKDLAKEVIENRFREDLYYRINVIQIKLPPLRERKEDIPLIVRYFTKRFCNEAGIPVKEISNDAMQRLIDYKWPGNIRELQNVVERAVLLSNGNIITADDLPDTLNDDSPFLNRAIDEKMSIRDYTKSFILKYENLYSEQQLADMLGITRKSLWEKRKKWGLLKKQQRPE